MHAIRFLPALRALLLAGALLPQTGQAEIRDDLVTSYYEVQVRESPSLGRQIRAASPIRRDDRVYTGHTDWHVKWRFRWRNEPAGCRLTSVTVELTGKMLLPALRGASPRQAADFDRYLMALRTHENGHYAHGQQAAREIERTLMSLPATASCSLLEERANRAGHEIIARYSAMDKQYDLETEHGRTQGATLQ